jgi:hypothetical protein
MLQNLIKIKYLKMKKTNKQIKSRSRVVNHGEVFTNEREVNAMLDLVKNETERLDSRFLEPACGTGNFLIEILTRKLSILKLKYRKSQYEYEKYSVIVVSSLYGIDLLKDNVDECVNRILKMYEDEHKSIFKKEMDKKLKKVLNFILIKNIICGDALTMKNSSNEGLFFSEWSMPFNDGRIKRKEYFFKDITEPSFFNGISENNDLGKKIIFPKVFKDYSLIKYLELANVQ